MSFSIANKSRQAIDISQTVRCIVAGQVCFGIASDLLDTHAFHKEYLGVPSLELRESDLRFWVIAQVEFIFYKMLSAYIWKLRSLKTSYDFDV